MTASEVSEVVQNEISNTQITDKRKAKNKPWAGWLKNKKRLARRDAPLTLTDGQVQKMIDDVEKMKGYTSLSEKEDRLIRYRDAALIATDWIFFKRGNEILHIRFGQVAITDKDLKVGIHIEKKQKRFRICPKCEPKVKNSLKSRFCKNCGDNISNVAPTVVGVKPELKTKTKRLDFPFCKYLVRWIKEIEKLGAKPEWWVFPRFHYFSHSFLFVNDKPLSIQRFDQILQRLDPSMTSAMFRYGGAEKYLEMGYSPYEMKQIGDWNSSLMPERYADKKDLTKTQRQWSDDLR
jgi:integrase